MAEFGYLRGDGMELIICRGSALSYPRHNHVSVLALGFVLEGALALVTDGKSRIIRAGGAFAVPPYAPHGINAGAPYTLLTLCVGADRASGQAAEEVISAAAPFLREAIGNPALEERVRQAFRGAMPAGPRPSGRREPAIGHLAAQLEAEPERRYSVDDMARAALMSKYELIRAFKREAGLTPHQFQLQNRVRKAQRLLEGAATMTEAALAAGFCDQSHFIRQFKRLVGLTPTEYKLACGTLPPLSLSYHTVS